MRAAVIALAVVSALNSHAQEPSAAHSRWQFGFYGSLDRCYRQLNQVDNDPDLASLIASRDQTEIPTLGFTAGIDLCFSFRTAWSFEMGIRYHEQGWASKKQSVGFIFIDPFDHEIPKNVRTKYMFDLIGIPVMVRQQFGEGALRFTPGIGVVGDFLLDVEYSRIIEYEDGHEETFRDDDGAYVFNTLSLFVHADLGMLYSLNDRLELRLSPIGSYQANRLIDGSVTAHLWTVGLQAGCRFQL